jgi:hypothetical protein
MQPHQRQYMCPIQKKNTYHSSIVGGVTILTQPAEALAGRPHRRHHGSQSVKSAS